MSGTLLGEVSVYKPSMGAQKHLTRLEKARRNPRTQIRSTREQVMLDQPFLAFSCYNMGPGYPRHTLISELAQMCFSSLLPQTGHVLESDSLGLHPGSVNGHVMSLNMKFNLSHSLSSLSKKWKQCMPYWDVLSIACDKVFNTMSGAIMNPQ